MENKKRLIDANEIIRNLWVGDAESVELRQYVVSLLENAPTIDAVEVVRCDDCVYWDDESIYCSIHKEHRCHDSYCFNGKKDK